jgi:ATP-dependent exoDNAse (exonuclease V) alpha subunit
VGAAAYRSAKKLYNDYDGLTHDYTDRKGVVHSEIILPDHAPREFYDRQTFWNAVEKAEENSTRKATARTAREVEIALPLELTPEQQLALVRDYVKDNFVRHSMGADISIHDGKHAHRKDDFHDEAESDSIIKKDNPHAHVLLTTREVNANGITDKIRDWNKRQNVTVWRKSWADAQNKELERLGHEVRVDHRSNKDRGIDKEPTKHEGAFVRKMEQDGIPTDRVRENTEIETKNELRQMFELLILVMLENKLR